MHVRSKKTLKSSIIFQFQKDFFHENHFKNSCPLYYHFSVHPKPFDKMFKPLSPPSKANSLVTFPFPDLPLIPRPNKKRKCRRKITKCTFKKAFRMFWRWMKKLERRKRRQRRRRRKNKKNRKRNKNYNNSNKDYRDQARHSFLQTFRKPLPIN